MKDRDLLKIRSIKSSMMTSSWEVKMLSTQNMMKRTYWEPYLKESPIYSDLSEFEETTLHTCQKGDAIYYQRMKKKNRLVPISQE